MPKTQQYRQIFRLSTIILFFWSFGQIAFAQPKVDTVATAFFNNLSQPTANLFEFDLRVRNDGDLWRRWVNGTYQFELPGLTQAEMEKCKLEYLDKTTDLALGPRPLGYQISQRIVTPNLVPNTITNRFSILAFGPDNFFDCINVLKDSNFRVGRFRITSPANIILPGSLKWLEPYEKYQANAYKIIEPKPPYREIHDNIEVTTTTIRYTIATVTIATPSLTCNAVYLHSKMIEVDWQTTSEIRNRGFVIVRGIRPPGQINDENVTYADTISRWQVNPSLLGHGTIPQSSKYQYIDTVQYRGENYVYKILYEDFDYILTVGCAHDVHVPNSVITYADALPNPFKDQTVLRYKLDDDVRLTLKIYEVTGELVATLLLNDVSEYSIRGEHSIVFNAPQIAPQGLYNAIFLASPIDDPSVELSSALVKLQLVR